MADKITREELTFTSADGASTIHAYVWTPEGAPRASLQITHGMAEHAQRYDEFARYLAAAGFVVAAHDQIGHGASCAADKRGCLPAKTGKDIMVEDVHALRKLVAERTGGAIPHFCFGHSLGSFITRIYISRYGEGLAGAIICGTGTVPVATSKAGNAVARLICALRGEDYQSKLLESMGVGAYAKAIENAQTPLDWLSYRRENVDAYIADELSGFPFSAGGYAVVTALTAEACSLECAKKVPADLPLLYVAGDGDPVGSMGEGVRQAVALAQEAGSVDVTCTIYENMRHEILNEDDRGQVMADILGWLEERI